MVKHKRNYLKSIGAGEQDFVPCEICGREAHHIHHIIFRSAGGTDAAGNLVALCGCCHERSHGTGVLGSISEKVLSDTAERRIARLR